MKTYKVDFTIEKSKEIETDLSNNTNKINSKSENKQEIRKNNDIKIQKSVINLGDSMVKHIHEWEIFKHLQSYGKIYVKQFSGARTKFMEDHMKPSLRENPDHFRGPSIKHVRKSFRGTNTSNPLIRTRRCAYQGVKNVSSSENFAYVLNG